MQEQQVLMQAVVRFAGASVRCICSVHIPAMIGHGFCDIMAQHLVMPEQAGAWQRALRGRTVLDRRRKT